MAPEDGHKTLEGWLADVSPRRVVLDEMKLEVKSIKRPFTGFSCYGRYAQYHNLEYIVAGGLRTALTSYHSGKLPIAGVRNDGDD